MKPWHRIASVGLAWLMQDKRTRASVPSPSGRGGRRLRRLAKIICPFLRSMWYDWLYAEPNTRLLQQSLPSSGLSWMNAHAASGPRWKPAPSDEVGSAKWPRRPGCPGPPSGQACRNSPARSLPLPRRLPRSGYAVRAGDASHWGRMIRTSSVPWKPWSIR